MATATCPRLDKALPIPGWMRDGELEWLARQAATHTVIAEIGSWRGRSTRAMADNLSPNSILFAIDPWSDDAIGIPGWWSARESPDRYTRRDWLWDEFRLNLADHIGTRVIPMRMFSAYAYEWLEPVGMKFDMVFIDGSHDFGHVTGDIQMFRRLLKPNGLICGHDYGEPTCPEVAPAVNAQFEHITVYDRIWSAV